MDKNAKIYVAGHRGLVGSAILRNLETDGYQNLLTRTHAELDLIDESLVESFFEHERPDYVFLAAAKVGGIQANDSYPAEFVRDNLAIQTNVIHAAYTSKVKRLLFLGSSCIYPRDCPQPLREEYLLTGPLEPTNRAYAIAKIAGIEMCWSYNRQYGTQYLSVMPTNLYGPGDNYNLATSHVLPALIRKFHEAKLAGLKEVVVWGTGTPRREFLYSDEMANACLFLMGLPDTEFEKLLNPPSSDFGPAAPLVNIGIGEDVTIQELAQMIKTVVGYKGNIVYDTSKPDGTPRKLMDVSLLGSMGWKSKIPLHEGLKLTYEAFRKEHAT